MHDTGHAPGIQACTDVCLTMEYLFLKSIIDANGLGNCTNKITYS